jgi:hypothetical protein
MKLLATVEECISEVVECVLQRNYKAKPLGNNHRVYSIMLKSKTRSQPVVDALSNVM